MSTHPEDQVEPAPLSSTGRDPDEPDWVEAEVERMADAWRRGERPTAEDVLARHPAVDDASAVRLIFEEVCLRRDAGLEAGTLEVVRKYPRWRADLEPLLAADRLMRPPTATPRARSSAEFGPAPRSTPPASPARFPEVGERLGDFRLLAELGRGAAGRTFLAAQPSLADRPVVLKVTARDQVEHLSLARLQHTHIVPLYSEQVFPDRGLRALCMPYLGGATLAQVLDALAATAPDRRRGRDILQALDRLAPAAPMPTPTPTTTGDRPAPAGPFRAFLDEASYTQAICWIAACLADALQYAHDHGLVHMDVKPSNVLIADDGQPMLLDFHLAVGPLRPGIGAVAGAIDRLGGTRGWMSPEQRAAMAAVIRGRDLTVVVDGRSDLYALGLLLDEALGGPIPENATDAPESRFRIRESGRLDRRNPRVGTGLADIVRRCLEPDPADRYPSAAALADDLRRHLNDLPLRGVPNRSLVERWRKWRRRRPDALTRGAARVAAVVALVAAVGWWWTHELQRAQDLTAALENARRLHDARRYEEAEQTAEHGLGLARWTLTAGPFTQALELERRRAIRGRRGEVLHELAERVRFRFGTATTLTGEIRELAPKLRKVWDDRATFAPSADGRDRLTSELELRLDADRLELAVVWADLLVRLATPDQIASARREAWEVLGQAETEFGPSPALTSDRLALARALGLPEPAGAKPTDRPAAGPSAHTAWEHYDLGRSHLRANRVRDAEAEFTRALELRPRDFWPNFYQGMCAYRLGRDADAVAALRACVTLDPGKAECRVNRALALERLGRTDEALSDYNAAIALDPRLAEAFLDRGLLKFRLGRPAEAIEDYRDALRRPIDGDRAGQVHYNLAVAHRALGDRAAVEIEARRALELGWAEARALLAPVKGPR